MLAIMGFLSDESGYSSLEFAKILACTFISQGLPTHLPQRQSETDCCRTRRTVRLFGIYRWTRQASTTRDPTIPREISLGILCRAIEKRLGRTRHSQSLRILDT